MRSNILKLGAWAGVVVIAIALIGNTLPFFSPKPDSGWRILDLAIVVLEAAASVVFYLVLGKLLGESFGVPKATTYFKVLVAVGVTFSVAEFIRLLLVPTFESMFIAIQLAILLVMGFYFLLTGLAINRWNGSLFGLSQAFGTSTIVAGILLLSVLGIPLAIVGLFVWSILGTVILFRAAAGPYEQVGDSALEFVDR